MGPIRQRIRDFIDQWTKPTPPPDVIPVKRTLAERFGDWLTDKTLGAMKRMLAAVLEWFARQLRRK